jgi:NAD(P)-dependent dehydrogenase (short-subunit alcohol dehydrogenase family)
VLGPGPLLTGKRAVVTGGGGGIGRGIAELFTAHGASVVVAEVDGARSESIRGVVDVVVECDVTTPDGVRALVDAAGDVDVLVNNVGHFLFGRHDFADSTEDEWARLHEVNFLHVLRCTRAFLPGMLARGRGGSIVSLSTVEAFRGVPQHAVYSAYKAAISAFTRSLALEVGNAGVRVNAIAPDLTESVQLPFTRWVPPEQERLIPTWVPVGRFGTAEDLAGVALFLASDLSAFVTGTTVHADGGSLAAGGWFRTERGGWTNRPLAP